MEPARLAEYLAVLRAAGVLSAKIPVKQVSGSCPDILEVTLAPAAASAAPFVDATGAPVNLDEGAPWNTREPESDTGDDLYRANFPGKPDEAS